MKNTCSENLHNLTKFTKNGQERPLQCLLIQKNNQFSNRFENTRTDTKMLGINYILCYLCISQVIPESKYRGG